MKYHLLLLNYFQISKFKFKFRSIEKKNQGSKELEQFMKGVVDFKNEDSICNFIKMFKAQFYDQGGVPNINVNFKKASFTGFLLISNILNKNEVVKHYLKIVSFNSY